jgi:dTMP kinase
MLSGFVTFEGIDGSGKTTVSRLVAKKIGSLGHTVFLTGEPTKSWIGDAVRRAVDEDVNVVAESFLFLADRAVHIAEIRSHLARRELVLCDRYADSTYAYQGVRLAGVVPDPIRFLQEASEPWVLSPDVTILLRVPPELGMKRIEGRSSRVRFEDLAILKEVSATYDRLAKSPRFVVVDGARSAEAVAEDATAAILKRLTTPEEV